MKLKIEKDPFKTFPVFQTRVDGRSTRGRRAVDARSAGTLLIPNPPGGNQSGGRCPNYLTRPGPEARRIHARKMRQPKGWCRASERLRLHARNAHARSRARVTSIRGLYDAATLLALVVLRLLKVIAFMNVSRRPRE